MAESKFRLTLTDGREVDFEGAFALPADRIELERRFNVSTSSLGTPEAREEWVLFLVYRAVKRNAPDAASGSFEEFLETLANYEFVGGEASANPTAEALPTG
jgi:hypothetical protein